MKLPLQQDPIEVWLQGVFYDQTEIPFQDVLGWRETASAKLLQGDRATMKMVSWNVNGIRACVNKGFNEYFAKTDADIFCIQETKL